MSTKTDSDGLAGTRAERRPDPRQRLGRAGERAAETALTRAGLRIVERRFRCRLGEIDLVARDRDVVVFVEVKARRHAGCGRPAEAVTPRKRRRIAQVALAYLSRHRLTSACCRFDVVEVMEEAGDLAVRHIRDAFRLTPTA